MTIYNIVGFECGNLEEVGTFGTNKGATATYNSTTVRTGSGSLKINPSGASTGWFNMMHADTTTEFNVTELYLTFYVYWVTFPTNWCFLPVFYNTDDTNFICFPIVYAGGTLNFRGTAEVGTGVTLSTGQWYRIDVHAVKNGTCTIWVDGVQKTTVTGNNVNVDYLRWGSVGNVETMELYIDDIYISTTEPGGNGKAYPLRPNGPGTYNQWNSGTYDDVDDVVPDDATSIIVSPALIDSHQTFTLEDLPAEVDIIDAIKPIGRFATGTNVYLLLYVYGLLDLIGNFNNTSGAYRTYSGNKLTHDGVQESGLAGDFTVAYLNDLEIGVVTESAVATSCTQLLLTVWYRTYFEATNAGALTTAGAITKKPLKVLDGTLTTAGEVVKIASRILAGTLTTAGALAKTPLKVLAGVLTTAGVTTRAINKTVGGTLTTAGTSTKIAKKVLQGFLYFIGVNPRGSEVRDGHGPYVKKVDELPLSVVQVREDIGLDITSTKARIVTIDQNKPWVKITQWD